MENPLPDRYPHVSVWPPQTVDVLKERHLFEIAFSIQYF
ncbi:MAG: hypothetical protein ACI9UN_001105 [Granulosicoccus sp.]|jgi:hypothetical protein